MKKHLIVLLLFCFIVFVNSAYAGYTNITTETFGTTMDVTQAPTSPSTTTSSNDTFIIVYQPSSNIMGVVGLMGLISIPFIAYIWNKKKDEY